MSGTDYTKTPNLGLYKPITNADPDQWGNHLNANADTLDTKFGIGGANGPFVPIAGATMQGSLTLSGPPTTTLMATTKAYVDSTVVQPATVAPGMDGTATVGTSLLYARQDHLHPTDSSRAPVASPVLTGNPQSVTPVTTDSSTSIATTAFVKAAIASGASIVVSDTPPTPQPNMLWFDSVGCNLYLYYSDPNSSQFINVTNAGGGSVVQVSDTPPSTTIQGSLWWDSTGLQLYCLFNDGTSTQWVPATNQSGLLAEAPTDSQLYARQNSVWTPVPNTTGNVGRNVVLNSRMDVQQRGQGPWTTNSSYTADRWLMPFQTTGGSMAVGFVALAPGSVGGDESIKNSLYITTVVGTGGAGDYMLLEQNTEDVRRLSGKTVTLSFWAWVSAGTATRIGVELSQGFGTGGSPSPSITGIGSQSFPLTTTPTRFSATIVMPSVAGKTFGTTAGTDTTVVYFWLSAGSNFAARAGNIGLQAGTFNITGVQLEVAAPGQTAPSPLEKIEYGDDLRHCQRFFQQIVNGLVCGFNSTAGQLYYNTFPYPVNMRAAPTVTVATGGTNNTTAVSFNSGNPSVANLQFTNTAAGLAWAFFTTSASADL